MCYLIDITGMDQKGTTLDHDFYVVVGKQCCTESAYAFFFYYSFVIFKFLTFQKYFLKNENEF